MARFGQHVEQRAGLSGAEARRVELAEGVGQVSDGAGRELLEAGRFAERGAVLVSERRGGARGHVGDEGDGGHSPWVSDGEVADRLELGLCSDVVRDALVVVPRVLELMLEEDVEGQGGVCGVGPGSRRGVGVGGEGRHEEGGEGGWGDWCGGMAVGEGVREEAGGGEEGVGCCGGGGGGGGVSGCCVGHRHELREGVGDAGIAILADVERRQAEAVTGGADRPGIVKIRVGRLDAEDVAREEAVVVQRVCHRTHGGGAKGVGGALADVLVGEVGRDGSQDETDVTNRLMLEGIV